MERKNKIVSIFLVLLVFLVIGFIILYKLSARQVYILDIPNSYNLSSISYELPDGLVTISDEVAMDKVLDGLYDLELSTQSVSVQEVPTDVLELVAIRLYYREDDVVGNFYIYRKNNNHFLEEPYNGIYKITEEEYNYIINLIKD